MKSFARSVLAPLLIVAVATAAEPGANLPKYSPFAQRGSGAAPDGTANENVEFAGVSSVGKKTDLIFYDKTTKKSHWIGLGETKGDIAVLNYDERLEQAVVKVNGVEKNLPLRKVTGTAGKPRPVAPLPTGFNTPTPAIMTAPSIVSVDNSAPNPALINNSVGNPPPAPSMSAPSAPAAPEAVQARQETEARMLVSDLLEIGMAQRRAYEEAQRKAASGEPQNPPTDPAQSPKS